VGDVAGKATPAALYGSLAIGTLREYAGRDCASPASTLAAMNERLRQLGVGNRFLAMAFAVFDSADRSLVLANSGLPYPFLLQGGAARRIEVHGVPLGLLPGSAYREVRLVLAPGDAVVLASDGIEEATDGSGEEFGRGRVEAALAGLGAGSATEIAQGLLAACRRFAGPAEPSDDRTVVVLKAAGRE
jgi:sigma-B regulation protein RsbU (phosphoserine phosphatase)